MFYSFSYCVDNVIIGFQLVVVIASQKIIIISIDELSSCVGWAR